MDKLCTAVTVDCPYHCGKKLMKKELQDHMKSCELRLIPCEYCKKEIVKITQLVSNYMSLPKLIITYSSNQCVSSSYKVNKGIKVQV